MTHKAVLCAKDARAPSVRRLVRRLVRGKSAHTFLLVRNLCIYMVPKLQQLVDEVIGRGPQADANVTVSGYMTTFHDSGGANLALLTIYPSDEEIRGGSRNAYMQSQNLWYILGVGQRILEPRVDADLQLPSSLPAGLFSSFPSPAAAADDLDFADDDDQSASGDISDDEESDDDSEGGAKRADLQLAIDAHRSVRGLHDDRLLQLEAAGLSLEVEETIAM
jgi:hypothetical protein